MRVIVDGTWGFASSSAVTKDEVAAVARQAAAIARANRAVNTDPVRLAPVEAYPDVEWNTPLTKDPFEMPLQPKIDLLLQINEAAMKVKDASFVSAFMLFVNEKKFFASSEGSYITQSLVRSYPTFTVTSVNRDTNRFYAAQRADRADGRRLRVHREPAARRGSARGRRRGRGHAQGQDRSSPGQKTLILHPSNLWLTIHESIGHPTELDRALGYEANFAGTRFLTTDKLGKFQFGSPLVTIVGDKTQERGLATCGYDDDGVKTTSFPIIKDGLFVDYQTTRDQAHLIDEKASHGCSYADNWSSIPFQRMPNVSLQPGEKPVTEQDIIGATEDGIYVKGDGS